MIRKLGLRCKRDAFGQKCPVYHLARFARRAWSTKRTCRGFVFVW